jgi:prevent-host-death family protein
MRRSYRDGSAHQHGPKALAPDGARAMTWQVQTAKQRFDELVERAVTEGPQIVTKHGRETVVVVEIEEYRRLTAPRLNFKEFLMSMPRVDDLEIERSIDMGREIDL